MYGEKFVDHRNEYENVMRTAVSAAAWLQEQQSKLEAAVIFLDAVVTQVSAAHLQAGAARHEGILRELESLLQEVSNPLLLLPAVC